MLTLFINFELNNLKIFIINSKKKQAFFLLIINNGISKEIFWPV